MTASCCVQVGKFLVMFSGPDREIVVNGEVMRFEDHPYFGPTLVGKRGDPLANQRWRHPFWEAACQWYDGGKRIAPNGRCLWAKKPKDILRHLGGRNWQVVGQEPVTDEPTELARG